jgi:fluoroacetyl-CoA thioesterase
MRSSLRPGLSTTFSYRVPETKTVPHLYPEAPEFQTMPRVFATGFLVGLVEWTCMKVIRDHLEWPVEQSVGTDVRLTHSAATPPGLTVCVRVELERVDGRRLLFRVSAHDGSDEICQGTHERHVIDSARFESRAARKRSE